MNLLKRILINFVSLIVYIAVLYFGIRLEEYYKQTTNNLTALILIYFLVPTCFGILLALPRVIKEFKNPGTWGLDWVSFLSVTLPTFLISMTPLFHFHTGIGRIIPIGQLFVGDLVPFQFLNIISIIFGYSLLSNLKKFETNE